MKFKKILLLLVSSISVGLISFLLTSNEIEKSLVFASNSCASHSGYHYEAVDSTSSNPGNKEFWACCVCHQQFLEKPDGTFEENTLDGYLDDQHIAYVAPVSIEKSVVFDQMTLEESGGKQYFSVLGSYTGDITTDYVYVDLILENAGGTLNYGGKAKTELILNNGTFDARVDISDMISMKTYTYYVPSLVVNNEKIDISTNFGNTKSGGVYLKTDNDTSQFRLQKFSNVFKLVRQSVVTEFAEGAEITGFTGISMSAINERLVVSLSGTSMNHTRTSLCLNIPDFKITRGTVTPAENMCSNNTVGVKFDDQTGNFSILFDVTDLETHSTAYKLNVSKENRTPNNNVGSSIGYIGFKPFAYEGVVDTTTVTKLNGKAYSFVYRSTGYAGDLCIQVKAA